MNLPIEFEEKMQDLLGGEYNDYGNRNRFSPAAHFIYKSRHNFALPFVNLRI